MSVQVLSQLRRGLSLPLIAGALLVSGIPESIAAVLLPENLNKPNREEVLRIIGFGTSSKILSDPYPLGGYAGFEIGFSVENLPTEDLGRLGNRLATPQQEVALPKFTIGKGLYNNLDLFIQFTPYNRQDELSQFGGILRWGFYQATFLPLSASVLAHLNNGNIGNQLNTQSFGADVIGGINVDNVALFLGLGVLRAKGTFIGGSRGITDSAQTETETVRGFHSILGANVHLSNAFITVQIDRYVLPVLSAKVGLRF